MRCGWGGHGVTQVLPEDPGAAGKFAAEDMVRRLVEYRAVAERITGSEESLTRPVAAQVNVGARRCGIGCRNALTWLRL